MTPATIKERLEAAKDFLEAARAELRAVAEETATATGNNAHTTVHRITCDLVWLRSAVAMEAIAELPPPETAA
jgi:hypothetical protein